jgi:transposase-like protein
MRDASAKGRLSIPRIRNRRAQQDAIRRYLEGGVTLEQVGAEFSVHAITVHRWVKEARRQHPRAVAS